MNILFLFDFNKEIGFIMKTIYLYVCMFLWVFVGRSVGWLVGFNGMLTHLSRGWGLSTFYVYTYIFVWFLFFFFYMVIVFANGPGDSIHDRTIPKTLKMVFDTSLLNTQQYKMHIKGKVEQSWERSSVFPYTSV